MHLYVIVVYMCVCGGRRDRITWGRRREGREGHIGDKGRDVRWKQKRRLLLFLDTSCLLPLSNSRGFQWCPISPFLSFPFDMTIYWIIMKKIKEKSQYVVMYMISGCISIILE